MWIGTLNGLCRYDGYGIKEHRNDPNDPQSLSSNILKDVLVNKYDRKWVGTHGSGLHLYDPVHDRIISVPANLRVAPPSPDYRLREPLYTLIISTTVRPSMVMPSTLAPAIATPANEPP